MARDTTAPGFVERDAVNGGQQIDGDRRHTQLDDLSCRGEIGRCQSQAAEAEVGERRQQPIGVLRSGSTNTSMSLVNRSWP